MNIIEFCSPHGENPFAPKSDQIFVCEDYILSQDQCDELRDIILRKEKEIMEEFPDSGDGQLQDLVIVLHLGSLTSIF